MFGAKPSSFVTSLLLGLQVLLGGGLLIFVMIGFTRASDDASFFALCQTLKTQYLVDIQQENISIQCSQRQWWQFHSRFLSPKQQYFDALQATVNLEKSRQKETKELHARIQLLSDQLANLRAQQNPISVSSLNYRQSESLANQLLLQFNTEWTAFQSQVTLVQSRLDNYSQASQEYIKFVSEFRQKSQNDQVKLAKDFQVKWQNERMEWLKRLYEVKEFKNSVTFEEFVVFFDTLPALSASQFVARGDVVTVDSSLISPANTGLFDDSKANIHVLQFAKNKGYTFRILYDGELVDVAGQKLPPKVAQAFTAMQTAAALDGISLTLTSGFRAKEQQSELFLTRFNQNSSVFSRSFSSQQIAEGLADKTLEETFKMTALPGTSKHQTGLAVDIGDGLVDSKVVAFIDTNAYKWLKEDNFMNAKRFGFLPSYPEGVAQIGPNPEPWEYVFVENLR